MTGSDKGRNTTAALLMRRLSTLVALSDAEIAHVQSLDATVRRHAARSELASARGGAMTRAIVSGWACRTRLLTDGRRQILSLLLPSDIYGPSLSPYGLHDDTVLALTAVETVDASFLSNDIPSRAPSGLATAARAMAAQELAQLRNQIVRLGRLTAFERLAHLLVELHTRLDGIGMAQQGTYAFPLTQEVLADMLGLSIVHVNRTMQQMRRDGLIETRSGEIRLVHARLLASVADWTAGELKTVSL